jgi:hypothetical protein
LCLALPFVRPADRQTPFSMGSRGGGVVAAAFVLACSAPYGALVTNIALSGQLLLLAGSCAMVAWSVRSEEIEVVLSGALACIVFAAGFAVLQQLNVVHPDYFIDSSGIPRVHSIYREPDYMGFFAAIGLLLSLRLRQRWYTQWAALSLCATVLVASFARAAWVAFIVTLVVTATVSAGRKQERHGSSQWPRGRAIAMAGLLVGLAISQSPLGRTLTARVSSAFDPSQRDVASTARSQQFEALWELATTAPWHGWGLSASGRVSVLGSIRYGSVVDNSVATSWIIGWWVDGGWLAAPLILTFIAGAWFGRSTTPGLLLLLTLVNSLFSNVMLSPFPWLALGLTIAALGHIHAGDAARPSKDASLSTASRIGRGDRLGVDGRAPRQVRM